MEVSDFLVRLIAEPTIPWGSSLLELSRGHLLLMGHSLPHAQSPLPGIWAPYTLLASLIYGTCLAPKSIYILMPVTGP